MALLAGLSRVNEQTRVRIGVWRMLGGMEIPKHDKIFPSMYYMNFKIKCRRVRRTRWLT